jgi:hypothetical protein
VKSIVLGWAGIEANEKDGDVAAVPDGSAVSQLAALVDVNGVEDQFDDGGVVYDDGTGKTHMIRPYSVRDVFTYPVSIGAAPTPSEVRALAEHQIRRLREPLGVSIEI